MGSGGLKGSEVQGLKKKKVGQKAIRLGSWKARLFANHSAL
jgi:hypothetical protein